MDELATTVNYVVLPRQDGRVAGTRNAANMVLITGGSDEVTMRGNAWQMLFVTTEVAPMAKTRQY